jgi:hypothetical protein
MLWLLVVHDVSSKQLIHYHNRYARLSRATRCLVDRTPYEIVKASNCSVALVGCLEALLSATTERVRL